MSEIEFENAPFSDCVRILIKWKTPREGRKKEICHLINDCLNLLPEMSPIIWNLFLMIFSTPVAKDVGVITSQITELRKFPCEAIFLANYFNGNWYYRNVKLAAKILPISIIKWFTKSCRRLKKQRFKGNSMHEIFLYTKLIFINL